MSSQHLFSPNDLIQHMDSLLRESKIEHSRKMVTSNYSWLRSKTLEGQSDNDELEQFKPIVLKMSSESCAMVAVKLDALLVTASNPADVLASIKNVLEEQQDIQLLENRVKFAKEKKKRKWNRVHPVLSPPGRQPTVSFILN
ncbi:unnamed protein product [Diatraea saccharalis]|uniref:Uncharacterized protein n=1 Tax=Diatraea saccharalis TaxID=40085 RepID=A0A9N9RCX9_9NEOP|nr:unnamed protein product [Diatraea saccharalis]